MDFTLVCMSQIKTAFIEVIAMDITMYQMGPRIYHAVSMFRRGPRVVHDPLEKEPGVWSGPRAAEVDPLEKGVNPLKEAITIDVPVVRRRCPFPAAFREVDVSLCEGNGTNKGFMERGAVGEKPPIFLGKGSLAKMADL